ncbi:MAG TPA: pantetheine-phosphate adenylyltransferase [Flavobacteriaceae bacterium]|nr:pantetheine-phosphate adenylyltransferase [Flavobacteriaceae bacterium]
MKRAIFPGSFDPFTKGHFSIVMRALPLFDHIVIAIGQNSEKSSMTPVEERIAGLERLFEKESKISVLKYSGLTMDFCKAQNAQFIIRGLRNAQDFNYEQSIAQTNLKLGAVETIFLSAEPHLSHLSSTIARDIAKYGGDIRTFLPDFNE